MASSKTTNSASIALFDEDTDEKPVGRRYQSQCHAGLAPAPILGVDASINLSVQLALNPLEPQI